VTSSASGRSFAAPTDDTELEEQLSRPTSGVVDALTACPGDVVVLGAGGKMGPSLTRMVRRAADSTGFPRRVIAVSRFQAGDTGERLRESGIEVVRADLSERSAIAGLPDAPNVISLVGQKFGTWDAPGATWMANVVVPTVIAERYRDSRIVALSTGNVYPLSPVSSGGSREDDPPGPVGEYAWTCLGRERVLTEASRRHGTRLAIVRLNYAVDLRYGVLVDIALKVRAGTPVDLRMGHVNVIWQGDASAQVIQCLAHAESPPWIVNVTGPDILPSRAVALELGRLLGREPVFAGAESPDALLSNTRKAQAAFGLPRLTSAQLIEWVADWVGRDGSTLGKATHFEEREGRF
jgi:nucleoside-diphosphate-sugar epimerase